MNDLNNIIIEGTIFRGYEFYKLDDKCKFTLVSNYFTKTKNELENEELFIDVVLSSSYKDKCKSGRDVRVVGRLCQENQDKLFILVEHIEFRPEFKKKDKKIKSSKHEFQSSEDNKNESK